MSGKENGIGCYLHNLKSRSKAIARDASKTSSKVHGCEDGDRSSDGYGQSTAHSAQEGHCTYRYQCSDYHGFCREALHEFGTQSQSSRMIEVAHREENPAANNLCGDD